MVTYAQVLILVAAAFIPPISYVLYVRNQEVFEREPWGRVFYVFTFGAIVSVAFSILFEFLAHSGFNWKYDVEELMPSTLLLVVVAAPIIEEFAKALGVVGGRSEVHEPEDGIIYGVAAGLGFSATENLLYGLSGLLEDGTYTALATIVLRSITGSFLHATAAGITGYGLARMWLRKGNLIEVAPYYAMAVLLHAAFNGLAVLQFALAVGILVVISFLAIRWTVQRIRHLDTMAGEKPQEPVIVR